jgi:hypothetical protein
MDILIFSILTNLIYFCSGSFFLKKNKCDFHGQFYILFIGVIFISSISLILNFFTPLTPLINSIVYTSVIVASTIKKKITLNKENLCFLIISSFVTFLLIIYSNVNRPDAGLYHLPYTSIINENKIIFGLSNIHFRFGHVSILQYLSAINNNYLFSENGISIPLASIVSFFYLYFFYDIWKVITKKENTNLSNFFSLFVLIYIAFKIARYSEFGNDAIAHLSFFYLISCLLKNNIKKINFNKILLISVFAFINKPTLVIIFIIPIIIFVLQNSFEFKKILYSLFSLPAFFLYLWLIKNIAVSGCAIYPIKITCIKNLPWTNIQQIVNINVESNAWSKAWPDRIDNNITMGEFSKNFNWIHAWSKKHLKHILNIVIPYVTTLFLIILYIKIKFKSTTVKNNKDFNASFLLCLITSGIGTFSFFLFFPLFRYGYSYIVTLISLLFILIIKNQISVKKNIQIFKIILISCFIVIMAKQGIRIFSNSKNKPWPNIYTLDSDSQIFSKKKTIINNNFFYYLANKGDQLCMYGKSPCTSYPVKKVKHISKFDYSFIILD